MIPEHLSVRPLHGADLDAALDAVAGLRLEIFREWPYLYDGTLDYERAYLDTYRDSPGALLIGAFDGDRLIGASTSTPMEDHADTFAEPLRAIKVPASAILFGAESVLLPGYRGLGLGHRFIDLREDHARGLGRSHVAFCSVSRSDQDRRKPANARTNDAFWQGRGYAPLAGVLAEFSWKDLGDTAETMKQLQFWMRQI